MCNITYSTIRFLTLEFLLKIFYKHDFSYIDRVLLQNVYLFYSFIMCFLYVSLEFWMKKYHRCYHIFLFVIKDTTNII